MMSYKADKVGLQWCSSDQNGHTFDTTAANRLPGISID